MQMQWAKEPVMLKHAPPMTSWIELQFDIVEIRLDFPFDWILEIQFDFPFDLMLRLNSEILWQAVCF